jgi:thymidylate synthase (FAD)
MEVYLARGTQSPLELLYVAYKTCYSKVKPHEIKIPVTETSIGDIPDKEKMEKFVREKLLMGHESPIEHVNFTFYIEGVSRVTQQQLTRHRVASYSIQSQRYVDAEYFSYVVPPTIRENEKALKIYISAMNNMKQAYKDLRGLDIPKEDARYTLPIATDSNMVMTMNARELRHFLQLRLCQRAQWEIRELSLKLFDLLKRECPVLTFNIIKCPVCHEDCKYAGGALNE